MKCIELDCEYYESLDEAYDRCNVFWEGYEIHNKECLLEQHICAEKHSVIMAEEALRIIIKRQ